MSRVLIAEDEVRVARFLRKGLEARGYRTTVAATGPEALALSRTGEHDLLILDLGLPGVDGMEVLRGLREEDVRMPVVILSARGDVSDVVEGLNLGADDYVAKPFRFDELLARVRARLRPDGTREQAVLSHGDLRLDVRTRVVEVAGRPVDLSARELRMLEVFLRHPDQVMSREQLLEHVWGHEVDSFSNVVAVYVGYLRRKVGEERVATVRGLGYALRRGEGDADREAATSA